MDWIRSSKIYEILYCQIICQLRAFKNLNTSSCVKRGCCGQKRWWPRASTRSMSIWRWAAYKKMSIERQFGVGWWGTQSRSFTRDYSGIHKSSHATEHEWLWMTIHNQRCQILEDLKSSWVLLKGWVQFKNQSAHNQPLEIMEDLKNHPGFCGNTLARALVFGTPLAYVQISLRLGGICFICFSLQIDQATFKWVLLNSFESKGDGSKYT